MQRDSEMGAEPPEIGDLPIDSSVPAPAIVPQNSDCKHSACRGWAKTDGAGNAARWRVGVVLGGVLLIYAGLSVRLAQIQVAQGPAWKQKADQQKTVRELKPAQRGTIYDATGLLPLAYCLPRDTIIADLKLLKD